MSLSVLSSTKPARPAPTTQQPIVTEFEDKLQLIRSVNAERYSKLIAVRTRLKRLYPLETDEGLTVLAKVTLLELDERANRINVCKIACV
jgi:hypothetical protein